METIIIAFVDLSVHITCISPVLNILTCLEYVFVNHVNHGLIINCLAYFEDCWSLSLKNTEWPPAATIETFFFHTVRHYTIVGKLRVCRLHYVPVG